MKQLSHVVLCLPCTAALERLAALVLAHDDDAKLLHARGDVISRISVCLAVLAALRLYGKGARIRDPLKTASAALIGAPLTAFSAVSGLVTGVFGGAIAGGVGGAVFGGAAALDARNAVADAAVVAGGRISDAARAAPGALAAATSRSDKSSAGASLDNAGAIVLVGNSSDHGRLNDGTGLRLPPASAAAAGAPISAAGEADASFTADSAAAPASAERFSSGRRAACPASGSAAAAAGASVAAGEASPASPSGSSTPAAGGAGSAGGADTDDADSALERETLAEARRIARCKTAYEILEVREALSSSRTGRLARSWICMLSNALPPPCMSDAAGCFVVNAQRLRAAAALQHFALLVSCACTRRCQRRPQRRRSTGRT